MSLHNGSQAVQPLDRPASRKDRSDARTTTPTGILSDAHDQAEATKNDQHNLEFSLTQG